MTSRRNRRNVAGSPSREHHPRFVPPQFRDLTIESGGVAGTVHSFTMTMGGRSTRYRVRVGEPEPGRVLIESDSTRRMLTTFTVDSVASGESLVRIETTWHTDGVKGLVERVVAPRMLRRVYATELDLLDRYVRDMPQPKAARAGRGLAAARGA